MKLFPDHWANPDIAFEIVPTPIGQRCADCGRAICDGDRGVILPHSGSDGDTELPWHQACFRRALGI